MRMHESQQEQQERLDMSRQYAKQAQLKAMTGRKPQKLQPHELISARYAATWGSSWDRWR